MKHPRLKRCPFCGADGEYRLGGFPVESSRLISAGCVGGHAESPQFETHEEAARWWNRRARRS